MTCHFILRTSDTKWSINIRCTWTVSGSQYCQFVGIVFEGEIRTPSKPTSGPFEVLICDHSEKRKEIHITQQTVGSAPALEYLIRALRKASDPSGPGSCLGGLVLPIADGYIVRSDIVPLRFVDCELFEAVVSFSTPLQYFSRGKADDDHDPSLLELLRAAAAGCFIRAELATGESQFVFKCVELELHNRLSFPWLLEDAQQQTLVIVEGGRAVPEAGGIAALIYPAAKALGLRIVVIDSPGHWLENEKYDTWRSRFLAVDLTFDEDILADKIVEALRGYGQAIHGIVTFCDGYQAGVARAAKRLSLPSLPPESYRVATDKYETSVAAGRQAYRGSRVDDAIAIANAKDLRFPLIVKPCKGWGSEGVFRVESLLELRHAISQIDSERHGAEFVVEEYCDGPEVDVNMVVYDGRMLFHEISDDYPKTAEGNDSVGSGSLATFIEMDSVAPSKLPPREQAILRQSFHDLLLRHHLKYGVYHVEGRLKHSSMEFKRDSDDILDLHPRLKSIESSKPIPCLLDLNPRPPGMTASIAPQNIYGVDYHALSMLIALRDESRVYALSQPFAQGHQYWCVMVYIPTDFPENRAGVFASDDVCTELMERRPDLAKHVSTCLCLVKRGDTVPHPNTGINTWVAYYNVFSRTSRRHALELAKAVRQETHYSFL
ncbi:MAG: hypothetical protein Q9160_001300 [Pyrenula sp. 1 TL-2023]